MLRQRGLWLVVLFAVLVAPAMGAAQTLADHVPADAIIYFGWRGVADPGLGYEGSHLKAVIDQSELPKLLREAVPAMIAQYSRQFPQVGQVADTLVAVGGPMWRQPSAFYLGALDLTDSEHPVPHVALLCDAGGDAANMVEKAQALADMANKNSPVKIQVKNVNNLVVVSTFDYANHEEKALSDDAGFKATLAQVGKEPFATLYVDGEKFTRQIDDVVAAAKDKDAAQTWPKIRDALGLAGLKRLAMTDGFDGRDWSSQIFVDAPAPRSGLLSLLDNAPLSDDALKVIPPTATIAGAGQFDFANLVKQIREGVAKIDTNAARQMDDGIGQVNDLVGLDVEKDLIASFGPEWAYYVDPTVGGFSSMGMTLINRPRDAAKLETSLNQLEDVANKAAKNALENSPAPFVRLELRQQTIDGNKVHFAALPIFTPAWTIKDGTWYFGLYPQVVVSAAARPAAGKSILDNPAYQDLRKRLGGPEKINGVTFADTPRIAPLAYQNLLVVSRLFLGAGDVFGLESPALVVPPLDKIMPELEPEGGITWVDDAGLHARSLSAFPGDLLFTADGGGGGATLIQMISSLGPYLAEQSKHSGF